MEITDFLEMLRNLVTTLGEEKTRELLKYWNWSDVDIDDLMVYVRDLYSKGTK
jgi:hypothetical protein